MSTSLPGARSGVRAALALLGAVTLAACSLPGSGDTAGSAERPSVDPSVTAAPEPDLDDFYAQSVQWGDCEDVDPPVGLTDVDAFECGTLTVPVDYDVPDEGSTELALVRLPTAGESQGSLVVNPGGPGGSGVDYALQAEFVASEAVLGAYDLVGFDPRGVFRSSGVDCLDDEAYTEFAEADPSPDDTAEFVDLERVSMALAEGCADDELAPHVDSVSVARDMDVLRAALGDAELTYLGKSYGTVLGSLYAELFPERVGRFVLDGAVDMTDYPPTDATMSLDQAAGFETAITSFVEDCLAQPDCPLSGSVEDGLGQVRGLLASLDAAPLPSQEDDRVLNQALAVLALAGPLYQYEAWPLLRQGLAQAFQGDGTTLLLINDIFADRTPDGGYRTNAGEAIYAVNCIDGGSDPDGVAALTVDDLRAIEPQVVEASPTFGSQFVYGGLPCLSWPHPPVAWPSPITGAGAAPIVVIGTTRDPATPLVWAERLSEQLESGSLLTFDGDGHTAYRTAGSGCVDDLVDAYLLDGTVPEDATVCVADY